MTGPFAVLGIGDDADERAIKVAYAKLLRQTRPDEDPAGFQRLNQAYQHALKIAQARQARQLASRGLASSAPMAATLNIAPGKSPEVTLRAAHTAQPPISPSVAIRAVPQPSAPLPQQPTFAPQAFIAEYRTMAAAGDAKALSRWLTDYPAFWHLPTKHGAGQWLLRTLFDMPEAMPEACFRATSEFFHFNDALSGIDPMALRRVAARIDAAWLAKPENQRVLEFRAFGNTLVRSRRITIAAVKRLSRPFRWWRDLPRALRPPDARNIARVATVLCDGNPDDLPPPFDREHARFWMEACNPAKARIRTLLALFRCAVALVMVPLAFGILVGTVQRLSQAPDWVDAAFEAWKIVALAVGFMVVLFWIPIGTRVLFREADALAQRSRAFRLLMLSFTPALCVTAMLVTRAVDATLGALIAIASMFIAVWRLRAIHGARKLKSIERVGLVVLFFVYVSGFITLATESALPINPELLPTLAIALIALAMWAFDWFKRGVLRPRIQNAPRSMRV